MEQQKLGIDHTGTFPIAKRQRHFGPCRPCHLVVASQPGCPRQAGKGLVVVAKFHVGEASFAISSGTTRLVEVAVFNGLGAGGDTFVGL